ncbi:MAG: hypothetical protein ABIN48_03480 [Ginsengibacter sp.]
MELITNNPFRIAGVLSNATVRELEIQRGKARAYARVGKEINSNYDFDILEPISRSLELIEKTFSNIEQNQDKVDHALFWFLNGNPFDDTAINYLKNGNQEKAIEIWEKVTLNKEINQKNFSSFSNLGTFKLLSQTQNEIKEGIEVKIKLIQSDCFKNFVLAVADETVIIDQDRQIEKLIDELLTQFKNQYSSAETLQFFSNSNGSTQKYLSLKLTQEPIYKIESLVESTKNKRKENNSRAYEFGLGLYSNCKDDLSLLKSLLGENDLRYKSVADLLANEIIQCGIDYFNDSQKKKIVGDYLESALKLTKLADSMAVGKLTKDRVKDNLIMLSEMKDQEISQAITLLQSVKDAYETNEEEIMREVKIQKLSLGYGQTINWTKVDGLIRNSIDWDQVIELTHNVIPRENIVRIKNSQNISKVNEYKKLVTFIFEKLNYSRKSQIQYLQYWEIVKTKESSGSTSPIQETPSTQDNDEIPSWFLWVVGIIIFIVVINTCN